MDKIIIRGGQPLSGVVEVGGSKNDVGARDNKTCVTWDGGIGLMQFSQAAATTDTLPPDGDLLSHLYRLGSAAAYNINAAAAKLNGLKKQDEATPPTRPAIGSGDRRVLESWYYTLLGYNGWGVQNDPATVAYPYQKRVLNWIALAPAGWWTWGLSKVGVPDVHDIGKAPNWLSTPYIPAPWHFDGSLVQYAPTLTITQASAKRSGSLLMVTLTLTNSGTAVAPNVRLTSGSLNGIATTTALTLARPTVAQQGTWAVTLRFPAASFTSGHTATLQIAGAYTGTDILNGAPFTATFAVGL